MTASVPLLSKAMKALRPASACVVLEKLRFKRGPVRGRPCLQLSSESRAKSLARRKLPKSSQAKSPDIATPSPPSRK